MHKWMAVLLLLVVSVEALGEQVQHVYHDGDIELTSRQELTIQDVVYHQRGNIYLRDDSKLTLSNSTLVFEGYSKSGRAPGLYGTPQDVWVLDRSFLDIEASHIDAEEGFPDAYVRIHTRDDASIRLSGADLPRQALHVQDRSSASITDSTVGPVYLSGSAGLVIASTEVEKDIMLVFSEGVSGTVKGLQPGYVLSWDSAADADLAGQGFHLSLTDCSVWGWSVRVGNDAQIRLVDCTIVHMDLLLEKVWSYPGFADSVALDIADVPASAGLGCFSGPSHCRFARIFSSFSSATVRCMYRFS